ncbi:MAG TPA: GNAT family N-acetyltransferase [Candidatus Thioglobus sp.]|nr:GNAT family N-acetyltransferase [Candidatus Thioglobus sp.]HIL20142.1 GNAT family N-acetyltransferase [Candidatus Thioglobus sp.]
MKVERATIEDIPGLCTLLDYLFEQESEFEPDKEIQSRGLSAVINGEDVGDILLVRQTSEIVAMVNLLYTVSTALGARVAILEDMVVLPKYRNQGVGSKLLDYAIQFAKEQGCQRTTLLTDDDNEGAHRFYQQHGFSRSSMLTFRQSLDD